MKFLLIIVLYSHGGETDRFAQIVEKCGPGSYQMFQVETLLAQTGRYDGTQRIEVSCGPVK